MITDNGPDYKCPICGADILGEIGHVCSEEEEEVRIPEGPSMIEEGDK